MITRTEILLALENALKKIDGKASPWDSTYEFNKNLGEQVTSTFKYFEEYEIFPAICFSAQEESRLHIGGGIRYGLILFNFRGYILEEDPIIASEDLLEDFEHVLDNIRKEEPCIEDALITDIETDEGILAPRGVFLVTVVLRYQVN